MLFFQSKRKKKRKERKTHGHIESPIFGSAAVFRSLQRQDRHNENVVVERSWAKMHLHNRPTLGQYKPLALEFQHEKVACS